MADIKDIEQEITEFWNKDKTFEKSLERTSDGKPYIFYDGPPFATGTPHYGHLLASALKDVFPRFFTMKGRYVKRNWGWDCHGLPVENIAEKDLGINSKDEIEKIGVKKFNDYCRSKVLTYDKDWRHYISKLGRWVDWEGGYKTMDTNYIESVWWAFQQLYNKEYLYEGEKILMYCPRCATPLAKSEIAMDNSYKVVKDLTVTVKLKLKNLENTYAIAWTTTPWTLSSNLALAVNPELIYSFVKDKSDNNTYVMAKDLIEKFYKSEEEYIISKEIPGKELENQEYEPLYPYFKDNPNSFKIILADFVTAVDGTGIVHIAPAFGEDDNAICRKYNIPMVQPVDETGHFTNEITNYAGEYIHDTNEKIVIDLKKSGKAIMSRKMEHEYPFCYRCDTKLIYRALPAWFVDIQKVKKRLLELNMDINWFPDHLKEGRMQHNISTAPDWNITRNRYWATAIPIWKTESGKIKVLGSIEELKEHATNLPEGVEIDLHKDFLDDIKLEIDGEVYTRIPEVLDCWFESGSMTFAQFHYPFENKEYFELHFPAQFVVEYIGQTRAWFYYMMSLSAILFDKIPFENVLTTGTILAEDGKKMSKSLKNYPDPLTTIDKYGADTLRFYMLASPVMSAENFSFSERGLEEIYKKVTVLLYNVSNFYQDYQIDGDEKYTESSDLMDKWIISRTEELNKVVEKNLETYNTVKACAFVRKYIEDLSTWYVRNSRDRFNNGDESARETLRYVLEKIAKILAPIIPFATEKIWQDMNGKDKSVHLEDYPATNESAINEDLMIEMKVTRDIVSTSLRGRDQAQIGIKWPLAKVTVETPVIPNKELTKIILEELNIKEIEYKQTEKLNAILDTNITPELEAEGFAREISRKIQALRKKAELVKSDSIELIISSEFNDKLESQIDFIKERVGATNLSLEESTKEFENNIDGKIKGKTFEIKFNKL
ncbi:isoleucine--tRNA ligase [Candidatus Pacearchaeota archaeon]|nr:isoleucine--tRNA ligase [Candidatus Pacearchaeota archaeon]